MEWLGHSKRWAINGGRSSDAKTDTSWSGTVMLKNGVLGRRVGSKVQVIQQESRLKRGSSTFRCFLEFGYHIRTERDDTGEEGHRYHHGVQIASLRIHLSIIYYVSTFSLFNSYFIYLRNLYFGIATR